MLRALLLQRLADWQDAYIEPVAQGQTVCTFRLELAGQAALFKFDPGARPPYLNSRRAEAAIQSMAADRGLAPRVLFADDQCILTEFVEADVLSGQQLQSAAHLRGLGHRLRALHSLPLSGRDYDARLAAEDYASAISDRATADYCLELVAALPEPDQRVLSHNDLVAGNILSTPELKFIDWEYACDNSPLFDVATIIAHHGLDHTAIEILLEARFGIIDEELQQSLAATIATYNALHWLWVAARDPADPALERIRRQLGLQDRSG